MSKQTKQVVKVSVPHVAIPNGAVQRVRFTARAKAVTVRTRGLPTIKVRPIQGLRSASTHFEAVTAGEMTVFMGKTPAQAFGRAAKWAWQ